MDFKGIAQVIEDFNDLTLDPNADRVEQDWKELNVPNIISRNNPYRMLYKASEGVRIGFINRWTYHCQAYFQRSHCW